MSHKLALITGASSGIGEAFARQLAEQGYDLCMTGRRKDRLESIASELRDRYQACAEPRRSIRVEVMATDFATDEGIQCVESWAQENAPIQMLINNAGFGTRSLFSNETAENTVAMIHVHNIAPVRLMSAVLPGMKQNNEGSIINVSSPASYFVMAGIGSYAGTKSFLNIFSECLARELAGMNIKIQVLLPGFTYSDFHKRPAYEGMDTYNMIPKFMWSTSEDVARASLKALGSRNLYCTPGLINKIGVLIGKSGLTRWAEGALKKISVGRE